MSICPGCGRCRECGQPAPITPAPSPWIQPWQQQPIWINPWPNTGTPIPTGPYQITCNAGSVL